MSLAKLTSFALVGIEATPVDVEIDVSRAIKPTTTLVGLAETAVRESIFRVERALANGGYHRIAQRIVINLAPADLRKDAPVFDLPIAVGMLAGSGQLDTERLGGVAMAAELALDGGTRPVRGALAMAMAAKEKGLRRLLLPAANAAEAAVVAEVEAIPIASLAEAALYLAGQLEIEPAAVDLQAQFARPLPGAVDFSDVRGQEAAKRALLLAAAGRHNVLLVGSPGTGKTMLARRLSTILPPLSLPESLETTRIYSAIGKTSADIPLHTARPFRSPHHTSSEVGMIGGGSIPQPGEVSLAHHGVLFLDELPEFSRRTLEVLRQPLEEGRVSITRARAKVELPADVLLVAAMNPCPCGYLGDESRCRCPAQQVERYLSRVSGPLLDRIDIQLEVPPIPFGELRGGPPGTDSATLRERVAVARAAQLKRFGDPAMVNGRMSGRQVRQHCELDAASENLLKLAMERMGLSIRAHDRLLKVARTIADLDESPAIRSPHLAEAIQLRRLDGRFGGR